MVLSGFEITDLTRLANVQGDGLAPEQESTGIWESTTNLVPNGGFGVDATGWGNTNTGNTVARSLLRSKFGISSLVVDDDGTSSYQGARTTAIPISTSTTYTWSFWIYPVSGTASPVISVIELLNGVEINNPIFLQFSAPLGVWTRVTATWTSAGAGINQSGLSVYGVNGSGVANFFLDGVQLEQQPLATPYVETAGSTQVRSASRVRLDASLDETQGWLAAKLRMDWANTQSPSGNPVVFDWRDDASNLIQLRFDTTGNTWEVQRRNGGGTGEVTKAGTFRSGDILTVIAAWDAANLKVSVNGSVFTSASAANIPTLATSLFDVGSIAGTSEHLDGEIFWLAAGTGVLIDANANLISRFNMDPKIADFPGTPTVFWDSGPDEIQKVLVMGMLGTGRV